MSIISFPRRAVSPLPLAPSRPRSSRGVQTRRTREVLGRHQRTKGRWAAIPSIYKALSMVVIAGILTVGGTLMTTARAVELHDLQSQLLTAQSAYASQVGSATNVSAPSVVIAQAKSLHLVNPTSVTQIPSVSLDVALALPKFSGWAPVTPRTAR